MNKLLLFILAIIGFAFGTFLLINTFKIFLLILNNREIGSNYIFYAIIRIPIRLFLIFYLIYPYCYQMLKDVFEID